MAVTLVFCATALLMGWITPQTIARQVEAAGPLGMVVYVVAVVVLELLWMPRAWGLLAGGALFGPWGGCALSLLGDTLGGGLCFLLARGAAHSLVAHKLQQHPRASQVLDYLARRRGVATIAVLRVCPVAHYTLISYAAGLAGVRVRSFFLGNLLGLLPAAVLYPLLGHAALRPFSPLLWISMVIILAFLAGSVLLGRRVLRDNEARSRADGL